MAKFSFRTLKSDEYISTTNVRTKEEAIIKFAKIKDLPIEKFLKLYEVVKRDY